MKIQKILFTLLFFISLASPVSATTEDKIIGEKLVTNIEIDGINYIYTQYSTELSNFTLVDNGEQVDVYEYNFQTNKLTMNNAAIGNTSFISPYSRAASCSIPLLSGLKDEQGNLAVYEGCATYTINAGGPTTSVIANLVVLTMIDAGIIKNKILIKLGTAALPTYLNYKISTARQQYRSKYTILNPYTGLYKYKHLYNSYYFWADQPWFGPNKSVWWF